MSDLRQAAQQALEYMKSVGQMDMYPEEWAIVERLEAALAQPLYTAPPQRQPLTDEEIEDIWNRFCDELGEASTNDAIDIARAIERAHGITTKD